MGSSWLRGLAALLLGLFALGRPAGASEPARFELCFVEGEAGEPQRPALVTEADLVDARDVRQRKGTSFFGTTWQHELHLTMSPEAASRLAAATSQAAGRRIAVVIDGAVRQRLMLVEPLPGPRIAIAAGFTEQEAAELARRLRPASRLP